MGLGRIFLLFAICCSGKPRAQEIKDLKRWKRDTKYLDFYPRQREILCKLECSGVFISWSPWGPHRGFWLNCNHLLDKYLGENLVFPLFSYFLSKRPLAFSGFVLLCQKSSKFLPCGNKFCGGSHEGLWNYLALNKNFVHLGIICHHLQPVAPTEFSRRICRIQSFCFSTRFAFPL